MTMDIKYLVIPDVHGRTFWIDPVNAVLADTDAKIIFLGDYLDPYPYEFTGDGNNPDPEYLQHTIDRFEQIIELKKKFPDRITLLIGNHDSGYAIGSYLCSSRMDYRNRGKISGLFEGNKDLFQLAEEADLGGRHFIFSHAGILKGWVKEVFEDQMMNLEFNVISEINRIWTERDKQKLEGLGMYDSYRGWGGYLFGSPIWSDIRSWIKITPEDTFGYNIVGHTQCNEVPVVFKTIADLDCRRAFYIDGNGILKFYDTDVTVEMTDINSVDEEF